MTGADMTSTRILERVALCPGGHGMQSLRCQLAFSSNLSLLRLAYMVC